MSICFLVCCILLAAGACETAGFDDDEPGMTGYDLDVAEEEFLPPIYEYEEDDLEKRNLGAAMRFRGKKSMGSAMRFRGKKSMGSAMRFRGKKSMGSAMRFRGKKNMGSAMRFGGKKSMGSATRLLE